MADWLIEEGIGETRALLIDGEQVLAAQLHWPGELPAGELCRAKLTAKLAGTRRGVAMLNNGTEALIDHLPPGLTEGQSLDVIVTRAALAERGRLKRAQARAITGVGPAPAPPFVDGTIVRRLPAGLWEEVWHAASRLTRFTWAKSRLSAFDRRDRESTSDRTAILATYILADGRRHRRFRPSAGVSSNNRGATHHSVLCVLTIARN